MKLQALVEPLVFEAVECVQEAHMNHVDHLKENIRNVMQVQRIFWKYSQTCVQRPPFGPQKLAAVDRWSFFRRHICEQSSK